MIIITIYIIINYVFCGVNLFVRLNKILCFDVYDTYDLCQMVVISYIYYSCTVRTYIQSRVKIEKIKKWHHVRSTDKLKKVIWISFRISCDHLQVVSTKIMKIIALLVRFHHNFHFFTNIFFF